MGLFSGIQDRFHKTEAAAVIIGLLEQQRAMGLVNFSIPRIANSLVAAAWRAAPHVFDGTQGPRPHKLAIAAAALTTGADVLIGNKSHEAEIRAFLGALAELLRAAIYGGQLCAPSAIDSEILEACSGALARMMDVIDPIDEKLMDDVNKKLDEHAAARQESCAHAS